MSAHHEARTLVRLSSSPLWIALRSSVPLSAYHGAINQPGRFGMDVQRRNLHASARTQQTATDSNRKVKAMKAAIAKGIPFTIEDLHVVVHDAIQSGQLSAAVEVLEQAGAAEAATGVELTPEPIHRALASATAYKDLAVCDRLVALMLEAPDRRLNQHTVSAYLSVVASQSPPDHARGLGFCERAEAYVPGAYSEYTAAVAAATQAAIAAAAKQVALEAAQHPTAPHTTAAAVAVPSLHDVLSSVVDALRDRAEGPAAYAGVLRGLSRTHLMFAQGHGAAGDKSRAKSRQTLLDRLYADGQAALRRQATSSVSASPSGQLAASAEAAAQPASPDTAAVLQSKEHVEAARALTDAYVVCLLAADDAVQAAQWLMTGTGAGAEAAASAAEPGSSPTGLMAPALSNSIVTAVLDNLLAKAVPALAGIPYSRNPNSTPAIATDIRNSVASTVDAVRSMVQKGLVDPILTAGRTDDICKALIGMGWWQDATSFLIDVITKEVQLRPSRLLARQSTRATSEKGTGTTKTDAGAAATAQPEALHTDASAAIEAAPHPMLATGVHGRPLAGPAVEAPSESAPDSTATTFLEAQDAPMEPFQGPEVLSGRRQQWVGLVSVTSVNRIMNDLATAGRTSLLQTVFETIDSIPDEDKVPPVWRLRPTHITFSIMLRHYAILEDVQTVRQLLVDMNARTDSRGAKMMPTAVARMAVLDLQDKLKARAAAGAGKAKTNEVGADTAATATTAAGVVEASPGEASPASAPGPDASPAVTTGAAATTSAGSSDLVSLMGPTVAVDDADAARQARIEALDAMVEKEVARQLERVSLGTHGVGKKASFIRAFSKQEALRMMKQMNKIVQEYFVLGQHGKAVALLLKCEAAYKRLTAQPDTVRLVLTGLRFAGPRHVSGWAEEVIEPSWGGKAVAPGGPWVVPPRAEGRGFGASVTLSAVMAEKATPDGDRGGIRDQRITALTDLWNILAGLVAAEVRAKALYAQTQAAAAAVAAVAKPGPAPAEATALANTSEATVAVADTDDAEGSEAPPAPQGPSILTALAYDQPNAALGLPPAKFVADTAMAMGLGELVPNSPGCLPDLMTRLRGFKARLAAQQPYAGPVNLHHVDPAEISEMEDTVPLMQHFVAKALNTCHTHQEEDSEVRAQLAGSASSLVRLSLQSSPLARAYQSFLAIYEAGMFQSQLTVSEFATTLMPNTLVVDVRSVRPDTAALMILTMLATTAHAHVLGLPHVALANAEPAGAGQAAEPANTGPATPEATAATEGVQTDTTTAPAAAVAPAARKPRNLLFVVGNSKNVTGTRLRHLFARELESEFGPVGTGSGSGGPTSGRSDDTEDDDDGFRGGRGGGGLRYAQNFRGYVIPGDALQSWLRSFERRAHAAAGEGSLEPLGCQPFVERPYGKRGWLQKQAQTHVETKALRETKAELKAKDYWGRAGSEAPVGTGVTGRPSVTPGRDVPRRTPGEPRTSAADLLQQYQRRREQELQ